VLVEIPTFGIKVFSFAPSPERLSRPDSGFGFQVKLPLTFQVVPLCSQALLEGNGVLER